MNRTPQDSFTIAEAARRLSMSIRQVRLLIAHGYIEVTDPLRAAKSAYTHISRDALIVFCINRGLRPERAM